MQQMAMMYHMTEIGDAIKKQKQTHQKKRCMGDV
jgi:hypothetical protein